MTWRSAAKLLRLIAVSGWSGPSAAAIDLYGLLKVRPRPCVVPRGLEHYAQIAEALGRVGVVQTQKLRGQTKSLRGGAERFPEATLLVKPIHLPIQQFDLLFCAV